MAVLLVIGPKTVERLRANIRDKLGMRDCVELATPSARTLVDL